MLTKQFYWKQIPWHTSKITANVNYHSVKISWNSLIRGSLPHYTTKRRWMEDQLFKFSKISSEKSNTKKVKHRSKTQKTQKTQ